MYSAAKSARTNRNSVFTASNSHAIQSLRAKIKSLDKSNPTHDFDPQSYGVELTQEQVIIFDKTKNIRRAYLIENKYKIGWVVDCDLNVCMICWREFGWYRGRTKHHCRACGALVCHDCSPYFTEISVLMEEKGSRVCKNCFGLKSGIFTPPPVTATTNTTQRPVAMDTTATNLFETPAVGRKGSNRQLNRSPKMQSEEKILQKYLEEMEKIDRDQLPKYEEAYRIMREIIPLDIYKSKASRLIKRGLPEDCANRIFNTKILWLIVTHPEDIKKIHLADFRSKYFYDGLDITEMRAIWYNLPKWNFESENPLEKGKAEWRDGFKSKLDDLVYKELIGKLSTNTIRHPAYQEADFLHLFDPTLPLMPRFHRSASYNQQAIQSPAGRDPYATPEQDESKYSPFCDPIDSHTNIKDRRQRYMNNFANENSEERREKKYRTLLEEINAEPVDDIDLDDDEEVPMQYIDEDEEEGAGGEDISSLEDGSTDELYHQNHPHSQKPFSQSAYKTPVNHHHQPQQQRLSSSQKQIHPTKQLSSSLAHSTSGSDLPSLQKKSSSSSQPYVAGRSLHSAQAIHSAMGRNGNIIATNPEQITPPKSALKQTSSYGNHPTNQSTTSSISTLSNTYNNSGLIPPPTATNSVKFSKSSNIPIQAPNSASKAERPTSQRLSQSLQTPSSLAKAFSFQGETQHSAQTRGRTTMDSNRMSPLRISSTNTLMKSSSGKSGLQNSTTPTTGRDYPILKPRISSDSPPSNPPGTHPDAFTTPVSVDTFPDHRHTDRWKTNHKFAVNNVDLETPASNTFTNVNSASSYKFLSTSKRYIPNINDFDSPDIFQAYDNLPMNDNSTYETEEDSPPYQPETSTPTAAVAPNTKVIPVSSSQTNGVSANTAQQTRDPSAGRNGNQATRYITPVQQKSQRPTSQLSQSLSRSSSRNTANHRLSPTNPNVTHNTGTSSSMSRMDADLQKLRNKEEIKLYLLIGNVSKTIAILNEGNTRLSDYFTTTEAQEILWQCMNTENINDTPLINQSILFLLDEKIVDVNSQELGKKHESILQKAVIQDNEYLGRELIRRGADILRMDREGQCPLSISLTCQFDWVMEEFSTTGREILLLTKGSMDMKFQYLSYFMMAGYAKKAYEMIEQEYVRITPEEATDLLNSCRGNFQQMKDPVETFELLESLGASIVD